MTIIDKKRYILVPNEGSLMQACEFPVVVRPFWTIEKNSIAGNKFIIQIVEIEIFRKFRTRPVKVA